MNVTFENLINVWDAQIPNLLVELVNHAVFAQTKLVFKLLLQNCLKPRILTSSLLMDTADNIFG